jgi:sterol 3beta-glucosyltransferase
MNLTVVAVGTRGDVEPHLALCQALLRAGYRARLCAPADFASSAQALKIPFHPIPVRFRHLIGSPEGGAMLGSGANGLRLLRELPVVAAKVAGEVITAIREACEDAHAVCHSPLGLPARFFALERNIPAIASFMQPLGFTRERPSPLFGMPASAPRVLNGASHVLLEELFWLAARPLMQRHLQQKLPRTGYFAGMRRSGSPLLFAYSPSLVPTPRDWTTGMRVTGYWTLPRETAWRPPSGLLDFLAAGRPPVCIGFGSMNGPRMDGVFDTALRVAAESGRRAIILTGWSGRLLPQAASRNVFVLESAPHDWLFPRAAAVIHHGGAGTTAAALRAGVPSVILPFFFDQAFWGRWLHERGLGSRPIPLRKLSDARLRRALDVAEAPGPTRARIRELARRLRDEDGPAAAVRAIDQILDRTAGLVRKTG